MRSIKAAASGRGSPAKPVPKSASTIACGSPSSLSPAFPLTPRPSLPRLSGFRIDDEHLLAGLLEESRDDSPVAAVRAAAADDGPALGPCEDLQGDARGFRAGSLHQLAGVASRFGGSHLLGGVERLELRHP